MTRFLGFYNAVKQKDYMNNLAQNIVPGVKPSQEKEFYVDQVGF